MPGVLAIVVEEPEAEQSTPAGVVMQPLSAAAAATEARPDKRASAAATVRAPTAAQGTEPRTGLQYLRLVRVADASGEATTAIELRTITEEEYEAWQGVMAVAFSWDPRPEEKEIWRSRTEFDRSLGAFDGKEMVGTSGAQTLQMVVPGGDAVSFAGITAVSVSPTHRRRGVLRAMMRWLFEDSRGRGEPFAALWAAESSIYGRFGFGTAIEGGSLTLSRSHAQLRDQSASSGRVRMMTAEEAKVVIPEVYPQATARIPGTILRAEADWRSYFFDPEYWREGATSARYAVYEVGGRARGFVCFRAKENWDGDIPGHELQVDDLQAVDADAYLALYRFCFGIDLVKTIKVRNRRAHEPVLQLLVDPRRCQRLLLDRIWLRIVDVPAALSARRYAVAGEIVLQVRDPALPEVDGRYLLRGGPDGAECSATEREPDLAIDSADLAAAYLGDSRLPQLGWLGRVAGEPEAISRAHLMLQWPEQPWCTVGF